MANNQVPEIIVKQLERFTHNFPDGEVIPLKNGRYALRFSVGEVKVATILPIGFPMASPNNFYASKPIGEMAACDIAESLLAFPVYLHFIHPAGWNCNKHGINTWAQLIATNIPRIAERCVRDGKG